MTPAQVTSARVVTDPSGRAIVHGVSSPTSGSMVVDVIRTLIDANINVGQAQLEAASQIADSLLSSVGGAAATVNDRLRLPQPEPTARLARVERADIIERPTVRAVPVSGQSKFTIDLPGVSANDIVVEATPRRVEISAHRPVGESGRGIQYDTSISLAQPVQPDAITATFDGGVLTIDLGEAASTATRRIDVGSGSDVTPRS